LLAPLDVVFDLLFQILANIIAKPATDNNRQIGPRMIKFPMASPGVKENKSSTPKIANDVSGFSWHLET